ncbi:MAG: serine/threonine protein kinase [Myxococcales bacterium]|nr:serine/threonine protein kinase [Myxococcales bacterium]
MAPVDPLTPTEIPSTDTVVSETEPRAPNAPSGPRGATVYQLGEVIGRGGMGEVLLARDQTIGRDVALKRLRAAAPSQELIDRFLREAKIQARLDHPAIAPVHELGHDSEGRPYFTMKRVAGTTMAALLDARTETPQRLLRGLVDVALAVELAHSRHVVHRDLKPSNIMLGDYGEVYVLDWGVARVLADSDDEPSRGFPDVLSLDGETKVGALLGTPGYMAPEQARGEPVGVAADVYALGAILFEILAGEPLHPRGPGALASTLDGGDPSPRRRAPLQGIAPELDHICREALAGDPTARPTARGFGNAIQAYLDGDRDQERRRALATELVGEARLASAAGDQALALNAAGRAVTFDPTSSAASTLIMELLLDTERTPPPELASALVAEEERLMRERSRRAIKPYLSLFMMAPLVPFLHVKSWPNLLLLYAAISLGIYMVWLNTRRHVSPTLTLASHLLVAILFTRLSGPFLFTPVFVCAILLSATTLPALVDRPSLVILWTVLAAASPLVLEWAGVLAPSWSFNEHGLLSFGTIFQPDQTFDRTVLVLANVAAVLVVGLFARVIGRDRRDAQRRVGIQLWRFQQLLPRADRTTPVGA